MRIAPSETIVGQPALMMRKLFREGCGRIWHESLVEQVLGVDFKTAKRIIRDLASEGYIQKAEVSREEVYENSIKGNSLAMASAAKPIKRERAEKKLEEFLQRVKIVNDSDYFLYKVQTVVVFGSYLTGKEFLNDIDVAIKLVPRLEDREEFGKLSDERINDAHMGGRIFSNITEMIAWPQTEVRRYLKARSRVISLHDTDDGVLEACESRVIYRRC